RDGEVLGRFHCSHAHCQTMSLADVVCFFGTDEMKTARVAAGLPAEDRQPESTKLVLLCDRFGRAKRSVANVLTVLTGTPECAQLITYDEFRETVIVTRPPPCRESERTSARETAEWSEEDSTRFAAWVASKYELDVSSSQVGEA